METLGAVGVCIAYNGMAGVIDGTMSMGTFFSFITTLLMLTRQVLSTCGTNCGAQPLQRVYRLLT